MTAFLETAKASTLGKMLALVSLAGNQVARVDSNHRHRNTLLAVLLACWSVHASAQPLPIDRPVHAFPSAGARQAADVVSWGTVLAAVALDTKASWDNPERGRAFALQGVRLGVTYGAVLIVKQLTHRIRPCAPACGIDDPSSSFYSAHTAYVFSTLGGPRLAVSLPLAVSTGGLRIVAGKHWLSDVLVGAGVGFLTSKIR